LTFIARTRSTRRASDDLRDPIHSRRTRQVIERFYRLAQGIDTTRLPGEELSQRGDCPTRHFGACCWLSSPPSRCIEQIHHSPGRFSYIRTHRERPRPRHALTRGVTRLHTSGLPKCPFSIRLCVLRMRCLASLVAAALSLNPCNPLPYLLPHRLVHVAPREADPARGLLRQGPCAFDE